MLHKAEEWKLIARAPKIKLMKEHGRSLRLDDDAEKKLMAASTQCRWRAHTQELFRDIIVLMRDTGMRNERELFRMRIENLNWEGRVIFVPDSKTPEGRRLVPMSQRVFEILRRRCETKNDGWVFPSKRSTSGHLRSIGRSATCFGTRALKPGSQRISFCIVRVTIMERGFSCERGTSPPS